jgi:putative phosphoesterase
MKIAIVSDSHDNWPLLKKAVEVANEHGCEVLLHAGDLIAPPGVAVLRNFNGNVHYIFGNNEGEKLGISRQVDASLNIKLHGNEMDETFGGVRVFMSHYPNVSVLAYKTGEYDLVVYGHDHTYYVEKNEKTVMVNPGEACGYQTGMATCSLFDSETREVERIVLQLG